MSSSLSHPSSSSSSFSNSYSSSLMGPPVGTPFLAASSLTKYQRKKKANGGNGSGSGAILPDESNTTLSLSQSHSLYAGSNQVVYGQLNAQGGLSSFYPTSLTPNISSLNLLGMGTEGVSPHDLMGYFGSPRPEDGGGSGSGMTPGHQFFMFGSAGRTPSSAPFSAGVSEVDTAERSRYEGGSMSGPRFSNYSSARRHDRHNYYRTGLTPVTNDNESPLKPSNNNTPLSDIGDISISSSVFSPSFSPGRSLGNPLSGLSERGDNRDRYRKREGICNPGDEVEGEIEGERVRRRRDMDAHFSSKSPRTEEALSMLADCIAVATKVSHGHNRSTHSSSISHSQPISPPLSPSTYVLKKTQSRPQSGAASAVKSGDRSFSLCHQQYFPMVSAHVKTHQIIRYHLSNSRFFINFSLTFSNFLFFFTYYIKLYALFLLPSATYILLTWIQFILFYYPSSPLSLCLSIPFP